MIHLRVESMFDYVQFLTTVKSPFTFSLGSFGFQL